MPLGFVWSFLPVHPLLHLTVYICFIVHRFVNIIPLPEVFVHNLGFVALFIQPLSGMFRRMYCSTLVPLTRCGFKRMKTNESNLPKIKFF